MRYGVLALLPSRRQSKIPVASARNQPMGMAIQMPLTPAPAVPTGCMPAGPGAQGADGEDHRHGGAVHCPEIAVEEEKNADAQVERGLNAEIACADGDHLRGIPAHKGGHEPGRQQADQTAG